MSYLQSLWHGVAWLAVGGLCLPSSVVMGNEVNPAASTPSAAPHPRASMHDVALAPGGLLVGQILDETMQPLRGAPVAIQVNGQTAASTTTDAEGVFAVAGLRGGVHQIVAGSSVENCRLWAPGTAPPHAAQNMRFVPGQQAIVRGQWGPPPAYSSFAHRAASWATNPWVIGSVVATAIAVPIVIHNLDDDDDKGS